MHDRKMELLLVEDNPGDAHLFQAFLEDSPAPFQVTQCARLSEATAQLAQGRTDAVLLDLGLPDSGGLSTLREARRAAPEVPIVVLTGLGDAQTALEALKEGAQDYLIKGKVEGHALVQALRYAVERQRLQAEKELVRLQQIAVKDEFLSHVSHELRSPLNAIYQFVSILADGLGGECTPQQKKYLEIVARNVGQLQAMIGELLDVTRAGAGKLAVDLQSTSLERCAEEAVQTVQGAAAAKGVALSVEIAADLPPAHADPDRVRQVLVNLLENAIRFTPAAGKASLRGWVEASEPDLLQCTVADTGCGIPQTEWTRIFERLSQASTANNGRHGLGLGLYICRELVTRQGGRIWVEASSEKGTTIRFTLPVLSLEKLLAPILSLEPHVPNALALIGVRLWLRSGWPSDTVRETVVREARYLLGRCAVADLDIVLPKLWPSGKAEYVFLVARADAQGAVVVDRRIRRNFERDEIFRREGIEWLVETRTMPFEPGAGGSEEGGVAKQTAQAIQQAIRDWAGPKGKGRDEQEADLDHR